MIISGRLRSDWKMVSSDRRLSNTAAGPALAAPAVAGIARHVQTPNPGLTSGLPRLVQGHRTSAPVQAALLWQLPTNGVRNRISMSAINLGDFHENPYYACRSGSFRTSAHVTTNANPCCRT
jgi:hypothetical protein